MKHRLNALNAILSGLQGGVLKVVDSVDACEEITAKTVLSASENISSLIKEGKNTAKKRRSLVDNKPVFEMLTRFSTEYRNKFNCCF